MPKLVDTALIDSTLFSKSDGFTASWYSTKCTYKALSTGATRLSSMES